MNDKEFFKLVQPINMLIGYAQSASDLTPESDLKGWSKRIIELADNAHKAWQSVACKESKGGESK